MKIHLLTTTILLLLFGSTAIRAQEAPTWERYFEELTAMEDAESASWENVYEQLAELAEHPMNINTATREDLERIPFLTNRQVEEICEYLYRYGEMKTLGELGMIESLDFQRRRLLRCLMYAEERPANTFPSLGNILKYGRQDVMATAKVPLYERKGDKEGYLGYPYRHSLRYGFHYGEYVKAGLVGAQDAGEPFLADKNKLGYDFYSFYLLVRKLGRLKTLVVGRYRLKMGLGLVINNDFTLGKVAMLSQMGRNTGSISAHSSRSEGNYLQGAAATYELAKGLDVSGFVSWRAIDATLNKDSQTIATIVTDGYHRTVAEMRKKHNASQWLAGGNVNYRYRGFHVGATGIVTGLDKDLRPKTSQLYRRYYASGNDFWNVSVDYGYISRRLTVDGETATGSCKAVATLNTLSYSLTEQLDVMALWRFYSYRYYSLFARSFSDGGSVQDENGLYGGLNWHPSRQLTVTAYTDYAFFAWPKYQMEANSHSWDNLVTATWQKDKWILNARYRVRFRNSGTLHRARLSADWQDGIWSLKAQGDLSCTDKKQGWMASGRAGLRLSKVQLYATAGYFHTDDYATRIYTYERGMTYSFSFPSYFGEGIRYALLARGDVSSRLILMGKVGTTNYFDRNSIGSGLQTISYSVMAEVEMQIRWKF